MEKIGVKELVILSSLLLPSQADALFHSKIPDENIEDRIKIAQMTRETHKNIGALLGQRIERDQSLEVGNALAEELKKMQLDLSQLPLSDLQGIFLQLDSEGVCYDVEEIFKTTERYDLFKKEIPLFLNQKDTGAFQGEVLRLKNLLKKSYERLLSLLIQKDNLKEYLFGYMQKYNAEIDEQVQSEFGLETGFSLMELELAVLKKVTPDLKSIKLDLEKHFAVNEDLTIDNIDGLLNEKGELFDIIAVKLKEDPQSLLHFEEIVKKAASIRSQHDLWQYYKETKKVDFVHRIMMQDLDSEILNSLDEMASYFYRFEELKN